MLHSKRNRNTANSKSHIHVMSVLRRDVVPRPPKAPKKSHDPKKWGREQSPKPIHHHRTPQNPTQPNHHRAPGSSTEQQTDGSKPQVSTAVFIPAQTIWGSGQNHVWVCSRSDVGCLCSFTFCLNLRPDPTEAFWRFRSTTREEVQKLKKVYLTETRWERQKTFCSRSESQSSENSSAQISTFNNQRRQTIILLWLSHVIMCSRVKVQLTDTVTYTDSNNLNEINVDFLPHNYLHFFIL